MADKIVCPEGHTKVWAKGLVPSRQGPKQRYVCFTCGRTFYKPKVTVKPKAKKSGKKKAG